MRVELVGDICAVGTVLVMNVTRNSGLLALRTGVTIVVVSKTSVCM
jgi:hypothetical protein